jgi:pimeloyl-ACP methyl ester carboxylesterase
MATPSRFPQKKARYGSRGSISSSATSGAARLSFCYPLGVFTHEQAARDIFSLLDHIGIGQYSAVGHSSGAMTLLHMATAQPDRLRAVIMSAGVPNLTDELRAFGQGEGCVRDLAPARQSWHAGGMDQMLALCEQFRAVTESTTDMNFTSARLGTISARTLIVYGDRDPLFPVELAVEQYRAIPEASLWVLPDRGHGTAFSREWSDEFVRVALDFLQDPDTSGPES